MRPSDVLYNSVMAINETEERVIKKIRQRREIGRKKYGVTMEREDLGMAEWLQHAQEEALDLAIYLERILSEIQRMKFRRDGD